MAKLINGEHWLDTGGVDINAHGGGMLLYGGVYNWFGEHKVAGELGNSAQVGVGVYTSRDLRRWENGGIALAVAETAGHDIQRGCILERPKVLFCARTGKFVMWFHLEPKGQGYGGAKVGVAVADRPAGPYAFVRSFRPDAGHWPVAGTRRELGEPESGLLAGLRLCGGPVDGYPADMVYRRDFAEGQMSRDQSLFLDDDGAAYQIRASEENGTLHISRLSDDFLGTSGVWERAFPGRFHEAPAMFKHAGPYYLFTSGCSGWDPNPARLSVAAGPVDGTWQPLPRHVRTARHHLRQPKRPRPPRRGKTRNVRLHGGPLATEERHRRPLRLAYHPLRRRRRAGTAVGGCVFGGGRSDVVQRLIRPAPHPSGSPVDTAAASSRAPFETPRTAAWSQ